MGLGSYWVETGWKTGLEIGWKCCCHAKHFVKQKQSQLRLGWSDMASLGPEACLVGARNALPKFSNKASKTLLVALTW